MISQGADEHYIVMKLKKYRDIELQKSNMIANLNAQGQDAKMKTEEEEKVLRREEKLGKMRQGRGKSAKRSAYVPFGQPSAWGGSIKLDSA